MFRLIREKFRRKTAAFFLIVFLVFCVLSAAGAEILPRIFAESGETEVALLSEVKDKNVTVVFAINNAQGVTSVDCQLLYDPAVIVFTGEVQVGDFVSLYAQLDAARPMLVWNEPEMGRIKLSLAMCNHVYSPEEVQEILANSEKQDSELMDDTLDPSLLTLAALSFSVSDPAAEKTKLQLSAQVDRSQTVQTFTVHLIDPDAESTVPPEPISQEFETTTPASEPTTQLPELTTNESEPTTGVTEPTSPVPENTTAPDEPITSAEPETDAPEPSIAFPADVPLIFRDGIVYAAPNTVVGNVRHYLRDGERVSFETFASVPSTYRFCTGMVFFAAGRCCPIVVLGDADGDGRVTAADARAALRYAVHLDDASLSRHSACDLSGYGFVTASEARLILRGAVGLEDPGEWFLAIRNAEAG